MKNVFLVLPLRFGERERQKLIYIAEAEAEAVFKEPCSISSVKADNEIALLSRSLDEIQKADAVMFPWLYDTAKTGRFLAQIVETYGIQKIFMKDEGYGK